MTETPVADTGAQMDICGAKLATWLGIDISSLFPVGAKVFGASSGASIDILGRILVTLTEPGREQTAKSTVRMIYVERNMARTYLSFSILQALGVVDTSFPRTKTGRLRLRLRWPVVARS